MDQEKARLMVKIYEKQGCQALNMGQRDVEGMGLDFLVTLASESPFPFISSNIMNARGEHVFKPWVVIKKGDTRFGVFGLLSPTARMPQGANVALPEAAATKAIEEMKAEGAQVIILLSQLSKEEARSLVATVKGIDFIFGDTSMIQDKTFQDLDGTLFLGTGQKGKVLQVVTFNITDPNAKPFVLRDQGMKLFEEIRDLDSKIKRYKKMGSIPRGANPQAQSDRYEKLIAGMLTQRKGLEDKIAALKPAEVNAPFVELATVMMNREVEADPQIDGWIKRFQESFPTGAHKPARTIRMNDAPTRPTMRPLPAGKVEKISPAVSPEKPSL